MDDKTVRNQNIDCLATRTLNVRYAHFGKICSLNDRLQIDSGLQKRENSSLCFQEFPRTFRIHGTEELPLPPWLKLNKHELEKKRSVSKVFLASKKK
jgi:hypothetical protein